MINREGCLKPYLSLLGIFEFLNNSFQPVNIFELKHMVSGDFPSPEFCSIKDCTEKIKYLKLFLPSNCSKWVIISLCSILKLKL